jgi:LmbE family N-acetylglucosaminyl deacetylase
MIASLAPVDILAVFAHPDYETFASGTFTKLSANGQRIQLVYATSGHAGGDLTGQGLKGEALAAFLPQLETLQAIFISSLSYAEASLCETRCFFHCYTTHTYN